MKLKWSQSADLSAPAPAGQPSRDDWRWQAGTGSETSLRNVNRNKYRNLKGFEYCRDQRCRSGHILLKRSHTVTLGKEEARALRKLEISYLAS